MSDPEADLVIGLRELAKIDGNEQSFALDRDGMRISVDYVGGSSSRLSLGARYDLVARAEATTTGAREAGYRKSARGGVLRGIRPMSITLREEAMDDRDAKAEGISREHQTGDASFDDLIYIDSPTTDPDLLHAVLCEQVRAAARELFGLGFEHIVIDDGNGHVQARISRFGRLADFIDEAPERVIAAFAKLLSGLPPVSASGAEHPKRSAAPIALAITGGIAMMVGSPLALFGIAGVYDCTEPSSDGEGTSLKDGCGGPAGLAFCVALVMGVIAMIAVRALARPRVSGRSDSHRQLSYIGIAALGWAAFSAFFVTALLAYASRV